MYFLVESRYVVIVDIVPPIVYLKAFFLTIKASAFDYEYVCHFYPILSEFPSPIPPVYCAQMLPPVYKKHRNGIYHRNLTIP